MASRKPSPARAAIQHNRSDELEGEPPHDAGLTPLLTALRVLIQQARQQALRAVDVVQVQTCWQIGRHIVEFEQQGEVRAAYGARLVPRLAASLTHEYGRGFDERNLRHMLSFFLAFPIWNALRTKLCWTHYRALLRVASEASRLWYMNEAEAQNRSARALDRQISTLHHDRLLLSRDKLAVEREANALLAPLQVSPREFIRDPVLLEFLGLPGTGKLLESKLEQALMDKLQSFLLELGKGFAFVARQQRVSTETQDFYVDLVFYNYLLRCFVLFDLKTGKLAHQDIGQMDMYVRIYDDLRRNPGDNPAVGIILCADKDASVVRYSVLAGSEQLFASKYRLVLPSEEELRAELNRETDELARLALLQADPPERPERAAVSVVSKRSTAAATEAKTKAKTKKKS